MGPILFRGRSVSRMAVWPPDHFPCVTCGRLLPSSEFCVSSEFILCQILTRCRECRGANEPIAHAPRVGKEG